MRIRTLKCAIVVVATVAGIIAMSTGGARHVAAAAGGTFQASGTGIVEFRGSIDATVSAHYPIMLTKDFGGDATISVSGSADRVSFLGFTVYFSPQSAHVSGSDVEIAVIGEEMQASASGTGIAYVKGSGTYAVDRQASQPWDGDAGSAIAVGATRSSTAGVFVAHGAGVVAVRGTIDYRGGTPAGVLLVKDIAGNATINVTGGERGEFMGFTAYAGASSATISGADVGVVVVGPDVNVMASGRGLAYALGGGAFSVNGAASEAWTLSGRFADIAP